MRFANYLVLTVLALSIFLACDRDARQEAITPQEETMLSLEKKRNATDLPMRATFFTDLDIAAIQAGAKDCSGSAEFPLPNVQTGGGNALHLGKFTTTILFCGAPVTDPTPEEAAAGLVFRYGELEGHFQAANGDLLYFGLSGVGEIFLTDEPGYDLEFRDDFPILGGTGRFEDATGMMTSRSLVNLTTNRTDHVWTGTISLAKK